MIKYRPDIDGLRALAVVPVVLFHLGFTSLVPGGFAGVDVFFVISGFLITKIIYNEIHLGTYSVLDFYARRVRRIFPALYVVYVFVIVLSLVLQFPSETQDVSKSLVSSILFVSNVFFYFSSGYFDQKMEFNPLLHTWSLSVEEQFYVIFPIVVFALRPLQERTRVYVLCLIGLASLAASEFVVRSDQMLAFYTVFFRAWELLLGSVLALIGGGRVRGPFLNNSISAVGLLLICFSYFGLSKSSVFPGLSALAPCLGAAALIYSGQNSLVGRVLSFKLFTAIGLVSYSLYLWHWPIIVFWKYWREPVGLREKGAVLLCCFLAAGLSYLFVERPLRRMRIESGPKGVVAVGVGCLVGMGFVAIVCGQVAPRLREIPVKAQEMLAYETYESRSVMRSGECFLTSADNDVSVFDKKKCLSVDAARRNVLIVGDSHAAHLWFGLSNVYKNINFLQATASGCKPVLNTAGEDRCVDLVSDVFTNYLSERKLDAVILSARWKEEDIDRVMETVTWLKSKVRYVFVIGPIVEYDQALPRVLAKGIYEGVSLDEFATSHRRERPISVDREFLKRDFPEGVVYLSSIDAICAQDCRLIVNQDVPLQFDYGHLTAEGSAYLARANKFGVAMGMVSKNTARESDSKY